MARERRGEFAAIESYALIGNGESAALVSRDRCIDWWADLTGHASDRC